MRERPRGRGSLIAPGLAATLGALAVAPAASPAASSVAPPSLAQFISAQFISAICSAAYRSALPREAPFLSENVGAMVKMMVGMEIKPTGNVDRDFVDMMVPHHQGATDMAQAELRHGHNEQLRRIAQEIIVTQQQEIAATGLALGQPFYVRSQAALPSMMPESCRGDLMPAYVEVWCEKDACAMPDILNRNTKWSKKMDTF